MLDSIAAEALLAESVALEGQGDEGDAMDEEVYYYKPGVTEIGFGGSNDRRTKLQRERDERATEQMIVKALNQSGAVDVQTLRD